MEWDKFLTYLCSALMAGTGGLWMYCSTNRRKRRATDAVLAILGSSLLGMVLAVVACRHLCRDFDGDALVVAIATLSGMIGVTPVALLNWVRKLIGSDLPNASQREPIGNPDSD